MRGQGELEAVEVEAQQQQKMNLEIELFDSYLLFKIKADPLHTSRLGSDTDKT